MGKSTISMAIFNGFLYVCQRVLSIRWVVKLQELTPTLGWSFFDDVTDALWYSMILASLVTVFVANKHQALHPTDWIEVTWNPKKTISEHLRMQKIIFYGPIFGGSTPISNR